MAIVRSISGQWQFSVAAGVRTTTATLVPLVLGQVLGHPAAGLMVGSGGFNVSLSDIGGPYRAKAVTMGVATLILAAAAFLGTVAGGILWVAVPLMFVMACTAALVAGLGNAAASEPQAQRVPIEPIYALVSYNQRFYDAVTTLAVHQSAIATPQAVPGLERFFEEVDAALRKLQEALQNRPPPRGFSIDEKSLGEARAHIHPLIPTRRAPPAAAGTDPPQHEAARDLAPLRTELEGLADEVVWMGKRVESLYRPETKPEGWSHTA